MCVHAQRDGAEAQHTPQSTHPNSQHPYTSKTHLPAHLGLERRDLLQDDAVLLLLRAGLPDGLDQLEEVSPGQMRARDVEEAVGEVRHVLVFFPICC